MLNQCNCIYTYKYLKEKTKTAQPKPCTMVCGKKKKPNEQSCESVTKNIVDVALLFS